MIPAKKSLGQNFLKSKEALRALVEAGQVTADDVILEVGPGKGVLTEELVKLAKKVVAVEKDDRLIELLQEKFKLEIGAGKLEILNQDILEFDETSLGLRPLPPKGDSLRQDFSNSANEGHPPLEGGHGEAGRGRYKIIANIPYYITGTFLQKFLESNFQPSTMVLMLQKEVAQRIVAKDGKESILSMSVKAFGNPKYIMTVKAKYFSPEPNVDSAIIAIYDISKNFFEPQAGSSPAKERLGEVEAKFFEIMKLGFAHKRKMLIGNLSEKYSRETILEAFAKAGVNEKARAEDLELSQWEKLITLF